MSSPPIMHHPNAGAGTGSLEAASSAFGMVMKQSGDETVGGLTREVTSHATTPPPPPEPRKPGTSPWRFLCVPFLATHRFYQGSLNFRVVSSVCLTASITLLSIGYWQSEVTKRDTLVRFQEKSLMKTEAVAAAVAEPFWRQDHKGVRTALNSSADGDKYMLYVRTTKGMPQDEFWDGIIQIEESTADQNEGAGKSAVRFRAMSLEDWRREKHSVQDVKPVVQPIIRQTTKSEPGVIGEVVLIPNYPRLKAAQREAAKRTLLYAVLLDVVLVVVVLLTLQRSVLSPMKHFGHTAQSLGKGNYGVRLQEEAKRPDELGDLARAFNYMAEENEAHTRDLEERVTARTQELATANGDLNEKIGLLQRSQEDIIENRKMGSVGRLAAGFAHEVNTPLSASLTASFLVESALEEIRDELQRPHPNLTEVDTLAQEALENTQTTLRPMIERAAEHVQSLKRIASIQLQKSANEEIVFDAGQALRDVVRSLTPDAHRQNTLLVEPPDEDCLLAARGNPATVSQALQNIIRNALQHAFPPHHARRVVSCHAYPQGNEVHLVVIDNGQGISPEEQVHIYDPYVTGARGKHGEGGVGMGLYFARQAALAMHGRIWCESAPGMGATFVLALPKATDSAVTTA